VGEVREGVRGLGWAKVAGAVRSSTVVVANVLGDTHHYELRQVHREE
jgi:hypothetical protein